MVLLADLACRPPETPRTMANVESKPMTIKTTRARQSSDWPSNVSLSVLAKPTTSSGASAAVNASLKLNAAEMRSDVMDVAAIKGMPSRLGSIWDQVMPYMATMAIHRAAGYCWTKILTISGSPANFWPVWFQLRVVRMARSAMRYQPPEENFPELSSVSK